MNISKIKMWRMNRGIVIVFTLQVEFIGLRRIDI